VVLQNMLLKRLWEVQQQQERERQEQEAAAAAGSSGMQVDGEAAAAAAPLQRAGVVQKDLVDWYMTSQLQRYALWQLQQSLQPQLKV
jgi:hypothetical protein